MTTRWTRDYATGMPICSICGAPREGRDSCCRCAPYVSREVFRSVYFSGDPTVPEAIVREFHDDYLHSCCDNLAQYIAQTTSPAE